MTSHASPTSSANQVQSFAIAVFGLALSLFAMDMIWSDVSLAQEQGSICAFSNESKPSIFIDPWNKDPEGKALRFGSIENSDESLIQNCKNIDGKFLAISLGTRETSLASDSADILFREDLAPNRCEITPRQLIESKLRPQRDQLKIARLRQLRNCVGIQFTSLSGMPLQVGNHPTCKWTKISPLIWKGEGATCTIKVHRGLAVSVRPVLNEKCLEPSPDVNGMDLDTLLQVLVAENEQAQAVSQTVGIARRRIVFANSPQLAPAEADSIYRFSHAFGLDVLPVNLEAITERAHDAVTSFVSMSWLTQNMGTWYNSHAVPLAAEAELIELRPDGRHRTVSTWTAYSTGQTLVPADWYGLFRTNRVPIPDFSFRHQQRYRIRLKFLHPADVPGLVKADLEQNLPTFDQTPQSFQTQLFPKFGLTKYSPRFGGFPTMGRGPKDSVSSEQMTANEQQILRFFRSLGVDAEFPRRYKFACQEENCRRVDRLTNVGVSQIDFTTNAIPGQVGAFTVSEIASTSLMAGRVQPSSFSGPQGARIECP